MGSGKSVVAGELVDNHGFLLIKFAGTLKRMVARLLSETGYDPIQVADMVDGRDKEKPIPYFDVVFRGQPIARIIDAMLLELFNDLAIPKAVVEDLMADLRDEPIEGLGVTTNLLRCALNKWFVDCILVPPGHHAALAAAVARHGMGPRPHHAEPVDHDRQAEGEGASGNGARHRYRRHALHQ
jgi:hypothetical protein